MPFGRRHPDDISTVTRFSVPIYTAGETAGFSAVIHGLAHGVWYGLALVVLNGSEYMHVTKSLLEVLDESADVDARESYSRRLMLSLPGLPAGEYTIRLSVFDLFQIWIQDFDQGDHQGLKHRSMGTLAAGSWKQEWLVSTTVKKLHVQESGAGSASTEHGNKMGLEELSAESEPGLLTREHEGQVRQFGEVPQYEDEEWVVQSDRSSSSSTSSRLSACALASAELGSTWKCILVPTRSCPMLQPTFSMSPVRRSSFNQVIWPCTHPHPPARFFCSANTSTNYNVYVM